MAGMPKRLAIARHAKSSWADPDIADHDRPLNARGRRAATVVGRHLREAGWEPELVLCSSATRTRETLELFGLPAATDVGIEDRLYGATAGALLARLKRVPDGVASVLVLAHNPGVEDLVRALVDEPDALPGKFPTGAVADLQLPMPTWRELEPGTCRLRGLLVPRQLGDA
jgi:phosphohistidine phosphatase